MALSNQRWPGLRKEQQGGEGGYSHLPTQSGLPREQGVGFPLSM